MKIRPVEAELFHADGRTDMVMLIVAFRNFAKRAGKFYVSAYKLTLKVLGTVQMVCQFSL